MARAAKSGGAAARARARQGHVRRSGEDARDVERDEGRGQALGGHDESPAARGQHVAGGRGGEPRRGEDEGGRAGRPGAGREQGLAARDPGAAEREGDEEHGGPRREAPQPAGESAPLGRRPPRRRPRPGPSASRRRRSPRWRGRGSPARPGDGGSGRAPARRRRGRGSRCARCSGRGRRRRRRRLPARRARQETGQARMAARHSASTSVPLHSRVTAIGAAGLPA